MRPPYASEAIARRAAENLRRTIDRALPAMAKDQTLTA
jgi:hypothetical protein